MADRFKYSEVRQKIIDAIRTDLIGPREAEELHRTSPRRFFYEVIRIQREKSQRSFEKIQRVLFRKRHFRKFGLPGMRKNAEELVPGSV